MNDLIYEPPKEQRYWVIRAKNGFFIPHFVEHGIVAIEHFDGVLRGELTAEQLLQNWEKRLNSLSAELVTRQEKRGKLYSFTSQIEDFVIEMKVGDLVLVPSPGRLLFGRVISEAYADDRLLQVPQIFDDEGKPVTLKAKLRRKVNWGPASDRNVANSALRLTLGSHRTVFCVDDYWREIHHVIYPFFQKDGSIYFSLRIRRLASIRNTSIAKVFTVLSEIEALARADAATRASIESIDIEALTERLDDDDQLNLRVKSHFMSPGEIWGAAAAIGGEAITYYMIYSAVFGSSKLGWKGFFDPRKLPAATEKYIVLAAKKIAEQIKAKKIDTAVNDLQLEENKTNTEALEAKNKDVMDVVAKPKRITGRGKKKTTLPSDTKNYPPT